MKFTRQAFLFAGIAGLAKGLTYLRLVRYI